VISLVLPTFNPGEKIDSTWAAVHQFVRTRTEPWEVLFVLDGCTDGTADRLDRLAENDSDPRVKVLSYPANRGKGYAVRTGLLAATGRVRAFTDVDLAYDFDDILRVVERVSEAAPAVIASRPHPDSLLLIPDRMLWYAFRRKLQSLAFHAATRLSLGLPHPDTQAGLKAFTAEVAEHIIPHLECDGFGFDCELLLACKRAGVPVTELPVRVKYEEGTTTSTFTGLKMLRELWAIRRRWRKRSLPALAAPAPVAQAA
jgi:glycosyltransferase involved in cell wall biosynthesis